MLVVVLTAHHDIHTIIVKITQINVCMLCFLISLFCRVNRGRIVCVVCKRLMTCTELCVCLRQQAHVTLPVNINRLTACILSVRL